MKKIIPWSLIVSLSLGLWSGPVQAVEVVTPTTTTQNTTGGLNAPTIITPPTQTQAQENTEKENDDAAKQAKSLGMMAIAAGTAMMAAGAAMMANPPTAPAGAALMAAGAALLMAGMQGLAAAGKMDANANKAGYNAATMDKIAGTSFKKDGSSGIKIDPNLLRDPKAAKVFEDLKAKTGLSPEDLADGLNSGKTIGEMIAKGGISAEKIDGMIAGATPMTSAEAMSKLGLTPEELAAMARNSSMGEDTYAQGAAGERKTASANPLDGLFGAKDGLMGASVNGSGVDTSKLSPDVQAALDKNGITSRSIFEMVSTQYKKKTPMMFGVQQNKPSPAAIGDSPFSNLKGTGLDI